MPCSWVRVLPPAWGALGSGSRWSKIGAVPGCGRLGDGALGRGQG